MKMKSKFLNIYLFIGCAGSPLLCASFLQLWQVGATLHCGPWVSHCSGFSCVEHRLQAYRLQYLWQTGSVVVEHGLSCSVACGIFLDQDSNLCLLYWQADSQPLYHQGSLENKFLKTCDFIIVLSSKTISKYLVMQNSLGVVDNQV